MYIYPTMRGQGVMEWNNSTLDRMDIEDLSEEVTFQETPG